ncbi:MAG TPA: TIGR03032 family protein [Tepidisphaeraceae bacterium]|nr:TIGR03032 family protein [Tepidisphaeraceae bacterium]
MAERGIELEFRDICCSHSESLPALLAQLRLSILISTYQTGHLVVVACRQGRLVMTFHQFQRAMGIAVKPGTIAVCTRKEVWFLRDSSDIAAKLQPSGQHDACFLARTSHFTDDIEAHESAWIGGEFWVVNTLFSCLSALHPHYSFAPRWRPSFVSVLRPEDRCHLNGLAVADGRPRYVTALAETDSPAGWRAVKQNGGCLIEIPSGRLLVRGLSLPHSPRLAGNQIFFLHSGHGSLDVADSQTGQVTTVAPVPGVARGLALYGGYALVGLSKARPTLEGVPIVARRDPLRCGLWLIDLRIGAIAAHLEFSTGVEEIFDVQVLPGIVFPYISGPSAVNDTGQPLWTIPPDPASAHQSLG